LRDGSTLWGCDGTRYTAFPATTIGPKENRLEFDRAVLFFSARLRQQHKWAVSAMFFCVL
jgi:hypothetical protein